MTEATTPKELCRLLGCDYPIAAFSHSREVVVAVSESGGFGVLGALSHNAAELEEDLAFIRERVGSRFGVDLVMPRHVRIGREEPSRPEPSSEEQARFLAALLDRFGVPAPDESQLAAGEVNSWNSTERTQELVDVALCSGTRLLASGLGPVPREIADRAHEVGVLVGGLVGRSDHVAAHLAVDSDLIVAQGTEAGGHTGEVGTMVLTPEVVELAAPVPVLAAGGISRGRQVAAALALGAVGVWTGSMWLTTEESELSGVERERLLKARSHETVRSRSSSGSWARQLKTAWTEAWDDPKGPGTLDLPFQDRLVRPAKRKIIEEAAKGNAGAWELLTPLVGQVVGTLNEVRPARAVFAELVAEFDAVLYGLAATDVGPRKDETTKEERR
jgi:NAD(P)H-dependent flavin oxidoreductase YrpB (nitropropane dioxygenase family)